MRIEVLDTSPSELNIIYSFTKYWLRASCITSTILGTFVNKRHKVPDIIDFSTADKIINK